MCLELGLEVCLFGCVSDVMLEHARRCGLSWSHGCHGCHGVGNVGRCRRRIMSGPKRAARSLCVGHAGIIGGEPLFFFPFWRHSKEIPQPKASGSRGSSIPGNIRRVVEESRKSARFFHGIARLHVTADSRTAARCVMGPTSVSAGRERDNVRASRKALEALC